MDVTSLCKSRCVQMTGFVCVRWCVHILHQYNPLTTDSHRSSFSPAMESFILHTQRSLARSLAQRSPLHAATTLKLRSSCFGNMILRHTVCSTRSSPLHFLLWAFHHSTIFSSKMAALWWPALRDWLSGQTRDSTSQHGSSRKPPQTAVQLEIVIEHNWKR